MSVKIKSAIKFALMGLLAMSFSASAFAEDGLSAKEKQEMYIMMCGSIKQLEKLSGEKISEADLAELKESRKLFVDVVLKGQPAIDEMIKEGNRTDVGPIGVMLTCSSVIATKDIFAKKGCLNLETNKKFKTGPGVALCATIMDRINAGNRN